MLFFSQTKRRTLQLILIAIGMGFISCPVAWGQANTDGQTPPETSALKKQPTSGTDLPPEPPAAKIDVAPLASDQQIQQRLTDILKATSWFVVPEVEVHEGVVISARSNQH